MTPSRISIAILALGGQGGGVLSDWLIDLAEHQGWLIQTTSVPGVAQRTGATLYYAELFRAEPGSDGEPVLALMPASGDVDVVIAAELMEAGRAMQRGLVTPDRTTLIASSHRAYAIAEKSALGDGRADPQRIFEAAAALARRFVCFDMAAVAQAHGTVISASLFGALAGAGVLPFARADFEAAIERSGVGVDASRKAFADAYACVAGEAHAQTERTAGDAPAQVDRAPGASSTAHGSRSDAALETGAAEQTAPALPSALRDAIDRLPEPVRVIATQGAAKLVDYLDFDYASDYIGRLGRIAGLDAAHGGAAHGWRLTQSVARHLALQMAYEDTIRVADLKTRASRFQRVRREVRAAPRQMLQMTEFMHPRVEEVADTLPVRWGSWLLDSPVLRGIVARRLARGRHVRTTSLRGFVPLWFLGRLRSYRRRTLRFARERAAVDAWLSRIEAMVASDYALACEVAQCARVLKGYGATAERGRRSFDALMQAAERLLGRPDAAGQLHRLHEAALADEDGCAFDDARKALAL